MGKIIFGIAIGFFLSLPFTFLGPKKNPWLYLAGCLASAGVGAGIGALCYESGYYMGPMIASFVVVLPAYIAFSLYYLFAFKIKGWSFLLSLLPTLGPWMCLLALNNFKTNDPLLFGLSIALSVLDVLGLVVYAYKTYEADQPFKPGKP